MNILILTGKFGMGHYSVANTLSEQLTSKIENTNVIVEDLFSCVLQNYSDIIYKSFSFLVKRGNYIYNLIYRGKDNRENNFHLTQRFLVTLANIIESRQIDIVISTLPLCSQLVSEYKQITGKRLLLITYITDVCCHSDWLYPQTDTYMTATEVTKNCLIEKGIPEEQILVSGIPVREQFRCKRKQINHSEQHLLIMGGGLGLLPKSKLFYRNLNELKNITTTIITGKNKALYNRLHNKLQNIEVLGYIDDVYHYMQQADLIISKPGGVTLFEAIYSELPILMLTPSLEQEIRNGAFIIENKMGVMLSKNNESSVSEIDSIIHDKELLSRLSSKSPLFKFHNLHRKKRKRSLSLLLIFITQKAKFIIVSEVSLSLALILFKP